VLLIVAVLALLLWKCVCKNKVPISFQKTLTEAERAEIEDEPNKKTDLSLEADQSKIMQDSM